MRLFVYGTLTDRSRLAAVVGPSITWRVVGRASVGGALYDCGEYPALVASAASDDSVLGVLLEFDDDRALARLDAYEGIDSGLYIRTELEVRLRDGARQTAWGYVYNRSTAGLPRIRAWPRGGD